ncbi:MAG: hypothetical protein II877_05300 [Synergistaceae bacterium]|nr:hypothetical protein [Synergistaceae bacterium]
MFAHLLLVNLTLRAVACFTITASVFRYIQDSGTGEITLRPSSYGFYLDAISS